MFYPDLFTKGLTQEFEPIELKVVKDGVENTIEFTGVRIGAAIDFDENDGFGQLPGSGIMIFLREDEKFVSYVCHFSEDKGLWEANLSVNPELNYDHIKEDLTNEVIQIGKSGEAPVISNVPEDRLQKAFEVAVDSYQAIE